MSDTWDAEDRAIARALDAASDAETEGADEHLVDEYRDVLGRMPVPEVPPAADLEDRIVAAALDRRPGTTRTLDVGRTRRTRRTHRIRLAALAIASVAAAVVIGLIVQQNGTTGRPAPGGHLSLATVQRTDIDALLRAPGARTGTFTPGAGRVAIARDGNGAVYDLTATEPLAIGLVSRGGTTVVGPTKPTGGAIAFVVDHPERVTAVTLIRNGQEIARAEHHTRLTRARRSASTRKPPTAQRATSAINRSASQSQRVAATSRHRFPTPPGAACRSDAFTRSEVLSTAVGRDRATRSAGAVDARLAPPFAAAAGTWAAEGVDTATTQRR